MVKMVDVSWIKDAFRFMKVMNRDDISIVGGLGVERPYIEGCYYFEGKKSWNFDDFKNIIGETYDIYWQEFIKKNSSYQHIYCDTLKGET
jgi:hypothetical protein